MAQYQNIDLHPGVSIDGVEFVSRNVAFPFVPEELYAVASPRENKLGIDIFASSRMMSVASAERIRQEVCDTMLRFASKPDEPIFLPVDV